MKEGIDKSSIGESILRRRRMRYLPLIALILYCVSGVPLHAYVDPGSGSLAIQAILAGFLGVLLAFKIYWKKLVAFFGNLFRRSANHEKGNPP